MSDQQLTGFFLINTLSGFLSGQNKYPAAPQHGRAPTNHHQRNKHLNVFVFWYAYVARMRSKKAKTSLGHWKFLRVASSETKSQQFERFEREGSKNSRIYMQYTHHYFSPDKVNK